MRAERILEYTVVMFLAVILICEGLLYVPGVKQHIDLTESVTVTNGTLQVNQTMYSTFQANLGVSCYVVNETVNYSNIYFYYDQNYPTSESTTRNWFGLSQHLLTIIRARNLHSRIVLLNATQLVKFLSNSLDAQSILVMASGVLPDTVFGKNLNLLSPWIQNGGTLVWIGSKIGNLSGTSKSGSSGTNLVTMGSSASDAFINQSYFGGNASYYPNASALSEHFGLNYKFALQNDGILVSALSSGKGEVVGSISGNYTNVAIIHSGRGSLVYFSGPLVEDTVVSTAIMNVIQSDLVELNAILFQRMVSLESNYQFTEKESHIIPSEYGNNHHSAVVFTVQVDYLGTFAKFDSLKLQ